MSPTPRLPRDVGQKTPQTTPLDVTTLEHSPETSGSPGGGGGGNGGITGGSGATFHYPHPSSTPLVRTPSRKRSDKSPSPPPGVSSDPIPREIENPILQLDEVESVENMCFFEPPSIVVSVTTDDEDNEGKDSSNAGGDHHDNGDRRHNASELRKSNNSDECGKTNEEVVAHTRTQLKRAWRTLFLLFAVFLLTLPYAIVAAIETTSHWPTLDNELFNARLVCDSVAMLQACFLPLMIIWADGALRAQLRRWWMWTRKLHCVCYCNIGPGKSCCGARRSRKPSDHDHVVAARKHTNNLQAVDPPIILS